MALISIINIIVFKKLIFFKSPLNLIIYYENRETEVFDVIYVMA